MTLRIVELQPGSPAAPRRLEYAYRTAAHYAVALAARADGWTIELALRPLPTGPIEKSFTSELFAPYVPEPRAFAALLDERAAGFMQLGHEDWANRIRIWELLVLEPSRRQGIGGALLSTAEEVARARGARALVLETQSCNVPAISFYRAQGFDLIGLDAAHYSNADVERGEVRLEMGRAVPYER